MIRWRSVFGFVGMGIGLHLMLYVGFVGLVRNGHKASRSDRTFVGQAPKRIPTPPQSSTWTRWAAR